MHITDPSAAPLSRLHGLDALRGVALLLGVALHASMSWLPGSSYFWIVSDSSSSLPLSGLFYVVHLFRMTVFFLLAGFFGRLLCERLGWGGFTRDRLRRIVAPLIAAWPLVMTGIVMSLVWAATIRSGGAAPPEPPPGPTFAPDDFPLAHLWFLYLLTIFYAVALPLRALTARLDRGGKVRAAFDALLRRATHPVGVLLLALPVALVLGLRPDWYGWFGVPTPDQSLIPNLCAIVAYGLAFAVGWGLHRRRELLARIEAHRHAHGAIALAAIALSLWQIGVAPALVPAAPDAATFGYALSYAVAGWGTTLALVGFALHHCSGADARVRYVADASYWIYLVHLPVVMALQVAASLLSWPWWIEYPLLLSTAVALMLASYHVGVRFTWVGAWLNGKRIARRVARRPDAVPATPNYDAV
jgi:glucan biosynthesis protein C